MSVTLYNELNKINLLSLKTGKRVLSVINWRLTPIIFDMELIYLGLETSNYHHDISSTLKYNTTQKSVTCLNDFSLQTACLNMKGSNAICHRCSVLIISLTVNGVGALHSADLDPYISILYLYKWRSPSQSKLPQIIFNMELTHLGLEASIWY